jgi:hypothetical protein
MNRFDTTLCADWSLWMEKVVQIITIWSDGSDIRYFIPMDFNGALD